MEVKVATTSEIPPGERKFVNIEGTEIVLVNLDGDYHAFANYCPHMGGPVGKGPLESVSDYDAEWSISCPFHGWRFDVESGEAIFPSRKRLKKYDIDLDKYDVYVEDKTIKVQL
jgi:nitrite reductase/ring-hydroxylating ferredoxin subunit